MATTGHTTLGFTPALYDLGHFPVLWDTVLQAPVQDPNQGGTNVYDRGAVFQDAGGNTYRVAGDGTVTLLYGGANPPAAQLPPDQRHPGRD